ncbi:hypothetical protein [Prosthecomicrobium hirschii]|uniref:hypothetical protein n=1 Tax=Prosthecodimorpha hirschii TaxID=665126 RepID=UPI00221E6AF9|nr:hypothetical protein [Prosthecomicrobium hirschii]MCW1841399.1 hypothetical protein [Prosthecomicrobium hirschii]
MSVHVVFRGPVPDFHDVQAILDKTGFELSLLEYPVKFEDHTGFLPMRRLGQRAGAEFYLGGAEDIRQIDDWAKVGFDRNFDKVASLYFGGDPEWIASAYAFASAFASATGGVVIDSEEGILQNPEEALEAARLIWTWANEQRINK